MKETFVKFILSLMTVSAAVYYGFDSVTYVIRDSLDMVTFVMSVCPCLRFSETP
jgi:hypothetical protein